MVVFYLILSVIAICLEWYIAKQFAEAAKAKGHDSSKYFWICFFLNVTGYLLVIALPDRGNVISAVSDELPDL